MEITSAVEQLAALGHSTRLAVFRLLVTAGTDGLSAGLIAERLALPPATLSFHLANLSRAGLLCSRQDGRFIHYAADFAAMDGLLAYLAEDCCRGAACLPKTAAARATACR